VSRHPSRRPAVHAPYLADPALGWASCPLCWGQRRIWEPVPARNGEGAVLIASDCPQCLGIGEVPR
jgi:hypothetical protein